MTDPDTEPTPHPFAEPDVPLTNEYAQHARERAETERQKIKDKADRDHEKAKARKGSRNERN